MTTKTGNIYISASMTYTIEIPKANRGFSTTTSSKKLSTLHRRSRQRTTTENGNIDVLGVNLGVTGKAAGD